MLGKSKWWGLLAVMVMAANLSGCLPAAIAYGAHKFSESRVEKAEKEQRSKDLATYTHYRTEMEKINTDREKAGLKRQPVMAQEEWISAQTAGRPAIAPNPPAPPKPEAAKAEKAQQK